MVSVVSNLRGAGFDWALLGVAAAFVAAGFGCVFLAGCALAVFGTTGSAVWAGTGDVLALIGSDVLMISAFGAALDLVEVEGLAIEIRVRMESFPGFSQGLYVSES